MAALKVQGLLLPHCLLPQALHLPPGFLAPHSRGTSPSLSLSLSLSLSHFVLFPLSLLSLGLPSEAQDSFPLLQRAMFGSPASTWTGLFL